VGDLAVPDIEDVVERLQEDVRVLNPISLARQPHAIRAKQLRIVRERRLFLGRSHVGEDQSADFEARVRWVLHRVFEVAVWRLGWGVQALTVPGILPAVVEAAEPIILDPPVVERCPAMRAVLGEQPRFSRAVSIEHQVLGQDPDP